MSKVIPVICPSCKKRLNANPELIGKRVRCPECRSPILVQMPNVPKPTSSANLESQQSRNAGPARQSRYSQRATGNSSLNRPYTQSAVSNVKRPDRRILVGIVATLSLLLIVLGILTYWLVNSQILNVAESKDSSKLNADLDESTNPGDGLRDILFADFEDGSYGDWIQEGRAFAGGPRQSYSTAERQDYFSHYPWPMNGRYMADALLVANRPMGPEYTGKLKSPPFEIARRYINFLAAARVDYVHLVIDGDIVCTGQRDPSIPFDRITPLVFDVSEYQGKTATIEVVDEGKKWREHVLVDHFVFSNADLRESWMQATIDEMKSQSIEVLGRQYYVGKVPISYENALDLAAVLGGNVLTIESDDEAKALGPHLRHGSWLGITNEEGVWKSDHGEIYTHQTWANGNSSGLPVVSNRNALISPEGDCGTTNQPLAHPVIEFGPQQTRSKYQLTNAVENRRLAEFLLDSQATFTLAVSDRYLYQWSSKGSSYSDSLPSERFEIQQVTLPKGFKVNEETESRFDFENQIRDLRIEEGNDDALRITKHLPRLQHFVIDKGDYKTWAGLAALKSGHPLKHFELRSVKLQAEQIQPLFEAEELRSVSFYVTQLSPEIGTMLLPHKNSLVSYSSNSCYGLGREGFQALGQQQRLRDAMLWGSDVRDEDLEHLGKIASLETTQLGGNPAITGKSFEHLKGWMNLKHLSLWGTSVDDQGISNLPLLPSLNRLTLGKSKITNSSFARISRLPAIEYLDVNETGIENEGIEQLLNCKLLRRIDAKDTQVTRSGLVVFFEKLPGFKTNVDDTAKVAVKKKNEIVVDQAPVSSIREISPTYDGPESVEQLRVATLPTFALADNRDEFKKWCEYQWSQLTKRGSGHLVIGKVQLEGTNDSKLVNSQDRILQDGTYAHLLKDLQRPFGLRAHGFEPVNVSLKRSSGQVIDVGTIQLKKLPQSELRSLRGQIQLEGQADVSSAIIELRIATGPQNLLGGSRPFGGEKVSINVEENGMVTGDGFSPARYYAYIRAPGYVFQFVTADFTQGSGADLGIVQLQKQKKVSIQYVPASFEAEFDISSTVNATVAGGETWRVEESSPIHGSLRGRFLEVTQEKGRLGFRPGEIKDELIDLGVGQLSDFIAVDRKAAKPSSVRNVALESGHVYLLHKPTYSNFVLFRIEKIE